jgi:hypothetical protein
LEKGTSELDNLDNKLPNNKGNTSNNRTGEKTGKRGNTLGDKARCETSNPSNKACKNRNKKVGNRNSKPNNKGGKSRIDVVICFYITDTFYPPPPQELFRFFKTPDFGLGNELVVVKLGFFIFKSPLF